jgi:hypothetical protein
MNFDANITKAFLDKIAQRGKNEALDQLAQEFLTELQQFQGILSPKHVRIGLATQKDYLQIEKLVRLAYFWRYSDQTGAKLGDLKATTDTPNTKTLVAKLVHHNQELILATFRLVKGELELYQFFSFENGESWSNYLKDTTPYEVERLAFHPLFELGPFRELQVRIIQDMQVVVQSLMTETNAWLGATIRSNVKRFLDFAQIKTEAIPGLKFAQNETTAWYLKLVPHYFKDFYAYHVIV